MKIYFAGSISAGRDDTPVYLEIVEDLRKYGQVLTEHIADQGISDQGESMEPKAVHDRDLEWLGQSDVLVGEVSIPSLGVGYEIGKAEEWGKGILLLHRVGSKRLSPMLSGADGVIFREYSDVAEIPAILEDYFSGLVLPGLS
jgi:hypothetical protein